jgi:hypothetical protein
MSKLVGMFETRERCRAGYASRLERFTDDSQLVDVSAPVADLPSQQRSCR